MRLWQQWLLTCCLCLCAVPARAQDTAVLAYRAGDYATARAQWLQALEPAQGSAERARLCYNIGNACYRQGELLPAVAWYTRSLRLRPRQSDVWHNLELARAEAGLEPADRGDLDATLVRMLSSLSMAESEWLLISLLGVLGLTLAAEAVFGRLFRGPAWLAALAVLLACAPWLWNLTHSSTRARMVIESKAAPARSEPGRTAKVLCELAPGTIVEETDSLPDWIEVETPKHGELWVRSSMLLSLEP